MNVNIKALTLLMRWVSAAEKRRFNEGVCGYPPEYGGDQEILEEAKQLFQDLDKKVKKCTT